jgi:DNA-directed RNA polymerase subunit RPC12/RpoP
MLAGVISSAQTSDGWSTVQCCKCGKEILMQTKSARRLIKDGWEGIACPECWEEILKTEPAYERARYANITYRINETGLLKEVGRIKRSNREMADYCIHQESIGRYKLNMSGSRSHFGHRSPFEGAGSWY